MAAVQWQLAAVRWEAQWSCMSAQVSWERNAKYWRLAREWGPFLPRARAGLGVTSLS